MIMYRRLLAEVKDPKTRVISKILAFMTNQHIMDRDFEVELEIIDKNIEVECELPENIKKTGDLMMQVAMRKRNRRRLQSMDLLLSGDGSPTRRKP